MFSNIIEFLAPQVYLEINDNETYPSPTKINLPEWYKKIITLPSNRTVKSCVPFLDTLTSGYLLKMPVDLYIEHNTKTNNLNQNNASQYAEAFNAESYYKNNYININFQSQFHAPHQLQESPLLEKNKSLAIHKIMNPWIIKTPKNYSCLFVPPLNNADDRFSIIPGIVDTDTWNMQINFPILINGDKYPTLETTIKKGTPYVQILPFKRESWKMKISSQKRSDFIKNILKFHLNFSSYKNHFWNKKSWK